MSLIVTVDQLSTAAEPSRLLAIHLPQFHPIPENDEWWGKGFTEWSNVAKARPWFPGHYQPHLPGELGFYDLRLPEAREAQASLARAHGIDGFIYYHYWFNGKLLLERPVLDMVRLGEPDFPFCLCWANENWTRSWTGTGGPLLMEQRYGPEDDRAHIRWMLPLFADRRYIKVRGMPVFFVYRLSRFPEPKRTLDVWREEAVKAGFPGLYVVRFETWQEHGDPGSMGADAAAEFQPDRRGLGRELPRFLPMRTLRKLRAVPAPFRRVVFHDYEAMIAAALERGDPGYKRFPCVCPGWDNTPRREGAPKGAWVALGSTPERYGRWLEGAIRRSVPYGAEERFTLVNAWNEWAEGNHLEPCQRYGRAYLEATREAVRRARAEGMPSSDGDDESPP